MEYQEWLRSFEAAAVQRSVDDDPRWETGARLHPTVVRSIQRFQVGEDGDGVSLIGKSACAGDPTYLAAVRLFVAEEQNHARLLARLLASAGASTIEGHWSDTAFVASRRLLGLRLELMTLMVAEVVALRYYRALRDGTAEVLLTEVAGRILADEQRHVPFHTRRLRDSFATLPRVARELVAGGWWVLLLGATTLVAIDHRHALSRLGVRPTRFVADVAALFRPIVNEIRRQPLGFVMAVHRAPVRAEDTIPR